MGQNVEDGEMSKRSAESKRGYHTKGAFGHNPWFLKKKEKPFQPKEQRRMMEVPETYHLTTEIKKSRWQKIWERIKKWIKQ